MKKAKEEFGVTALTHDEKAGVLKSAKVKKIPRASAEYSMWQYHLTKDPKYVIESILRRAKEEKNRKAKLSQKRGKA